MKLMINAQERDFPDLPDQSTLRQLISAMELKGDRIAVEHNGAIVARTEWDTTQLHSGDRLEVVHFVGGGTDS